MTRSAAIERRLTGLIICVLAGLDCFLGRLFPNAKAVTKVVAELDCEVQDEFPNSDLCVR